MYLRMKQAIQWLKREKNLLQKDIAVQMEMSEVSFSRGMERVKIKNDEDFVIKFYQSTGEVFSLDWLLYGNGDKFAPKKAEPTQQSDSKVSSRELEMANRVIESLERESETSHKLIKEKDDHIADLRQQIADLAKLAEERLHRIAELRRIIDAHDLTTTGFPIHPLGTAEDKPSRPMK
jgi:hypothetical protein